MVHKPRTNTDRTLTDFDIGDIVSHPFEETGVRLGKVIDKDPRLGDVVVDWETSLNVDNRVWGMNPDSLQTVEVFYKSGTVDEYTVVVNGEDVYGMSKNPGKPRGFNQYVGNMGRMDRENFGERQVLSEIPEPVKEAVKRRIEPELYGAE